VTGAPSGSPEQQALRQALLDAGLLLDTGCPGVYGQSGAFLEVRLRLTELIRRAAAPDASEAMSFPPVLPRERLEATGYLASFPHLTGTVHAFDGSEADAARLATLAERHQDWSALSSTTDLALVPAACHPVYPAVAAQGVVPAGGRTIELSPAVVFRREPSKDPARWQVFHVHELVRVADPDTVLRWRQAWLDRALALLTGLGLDVTCEQASDPFFGRPGRLLAANQRQQQLKFELTVPVTAPAPTALASFNYHREHFAEVYGLQAGDGWPVHTACLGFGLERVTVALLARHGFDPVRWPASVREQLWW